MSHMPDKPLTAAEIAAKARRLALLRARIKTSGHNQRSIAEKLEVSEPTVSKWLSGKQAMTVEQFCEIAALIGAEPEEVIGGPEGKARVIRYRELASIAAELTDEQLKALEAVARQMVPRSNKS
jgi:transcriptional regulator with XRE-family HTH domain